jgi:RNA polymerase sigma factor (sigma-70 family)
MTQQEFNTALLELQPTLKQFAYSLTRDWSEVADLVQECYLKALKHRESFNGENMKAWLTTILKNVFINHYRLEAHHPGVIKATIDIHQLINIPGSSSPESLYIASELQTVIDTVPEKYNKPFQMYLDGFPYDEIAQLLVMPMGTVQNYIHRARACAKQLIQDDEK